MNLGKWGDTSRRRKKESSTMNVKRRIIGAHTFMETNVKIMHKKMGTKNKLEDYA